MTAALKRPESVAIDNAGSVGRMDVRFWLLVPGLFAVLIDPFLPRGVLTGGLLVAASAMAPLSGFLAVRFQSLRRPGWTVLTVGFLLASVGEAVDFMNSAATDPFGRGTIDVIFLVAYVVQLIGVMSLFQQQSFSERRYGWFDAAVLAVAVGTVVWSAMYQTIFGRGQAGPLDWITRFGGAALGVALVVTSLRLVLATRGRQRAYVLLLCSFAVQIVADSIAALWSGYRNGDATDALWILGYVMAGASFLLADRSIEPLRAPTKRASVEFRHTVVLQAFVTVVLVVLMMTEAAPVTPFATLVVWSAAWVTILVLTLTRVFGLLRTVGIASETESHQRVSAMLAGSSDVLGLADSDGTIRYLTPSIETLTGIAPEAWIGQRFDVMLSTCLRGLDGLPMRLAGLGQADEEEFECTAAPPGGGRERTLKVRIANHTATPGVDGWVINAHDVTDEARLTAELRHQALHDTLTALPNRALLSDRIQHALDRMCRSESGRLALVLLDLDDFKSVNDSLGHDSGDVLLKAVGRLMVESVRPGDTVARLGGDEFAMLFEDVELAEAVDLANRVLANLAVPIAVNGSDLALEASIGVVWVGGVPSDPVTLLRSADIAMYASKRDGKGRVTVFDDHMHEVAQQQLELRMDLAVALQRDEFRLLYQPIVDTRLSCIAGAEALLRWVHPRRGMVSPLEFIPIAEQSGHIRAIGEWVLRSACAEAASWSGPAANSYVSVNVSAPQLTDGRFVEIVLDTLHTTGLAPRRLLLEITESMLVNDTTSALSVLEHLRGLGVRIAIDDFGTGYSSLAYLNSLSADVVKIDRSFVDGISSNGDNRALTASIVTLAAGLGMTTIAEGVESTADYASIVGLDCAYVQGYLFSKPVTATVLAGLYESLDVLSIAGNKRGVPVTR